MAQFHQLPQPQVVGRFLLRGPRHLHQLAHLNKRLVLLRGGGVQTNQVPPHKYFGALFGFELTEQFWLRLFDGDRRVCVGHERFGRVN